MLRDAGVLVRSQLAPFLVGVVPTHKQLVT